MKIRKFNESSIDDMLIALSDETYAKYVSNKITIHFPELDRTGDNMNITSKIEDYLSKMSVINTDLEILLHNLKDNGYKYSMTVTHKDKLEISILVTKEYIELEDIVDRLISTKKFNQSIIDDITTTMFAKYDILVTTARLVTGNIEIKTRNNMARDDDKFKMIENDVKDSNTIKRINMRHDLYSNGTKAYTYINLVI